MKMLRSEAVDIFKKWKVEGSFIRVQGSFPKYAFSCAGRVLSVGDGELAIMADNKGSEIVIKLADDLEFGYADSRQVTGEEKKYEECVVLFFGPVPDAGDADTISLGALKS